MTTSDIKKLDSKAHMKTVKHIIENLDFAIYDWDCGHVIAIIKGVDRAREFWNNVANRQYEKLRLFVVPRGIKPGQRYFDSQDAILDGLILIPSKVYEANGFIGLDSPADRYRKMLDILVENDISFKID